MKIQATSLAATLLFNKAMATSITQTKDATAAASAYSVDVEDANKFVGRVKYALIFDPWVRDQFIQTSAHDKDTHACIFEFKNAHPWQEEYGVTAPAQHLSHNCPTQLVTAIYFKTTVPDTSLVRQTLDSSQPALELPGDGTTCITSNLTSPKTEAGAVAGSQDAWHFPLNNDFNPDTSTWGYEYEFVLSGGLNMVTRESPVFASEPRSDYFTQENLELDRYVFKSVRLSEDFLRSCGTVQVPTITKIDG